ncbi:MAG: UvrD-helicase domain-containing protein [Reichenbachiella sp.]
MKNFSIYRASAGSGKTYLLTYNYIKLALQGPDNFKSILAVTFTNKAMEEMKHRIVETLEKLSVGEHSMRSDLTHDLKISEDELKDRSSRLLITLLHNYSYFAISTIDTFFQRVVRSFAREMGIQSGFKIELDQTKILSDVIDEMMKNMAVDQQLVSWLTDFAIHQINAGKNWDTKRQIKQLSGELFKEEVVLRKNEIFGLLDDPKFMSDFVKLVFHQKSAFEDAYQSLGQSAVDKASEYGLSMVDFSYGAGGVGGYFFSVSGGEVKEPGKRVISALEDGKWAKAKSPSLPSIESAIADGLDLAVANMVSFYKDNITKYHTINQVSNYLYTLGLLSKVSESLQDFKTENELVLISDFPVFLNEIINDSDSPFVYEKIGNRYSHYLIDEFQDTSGLQWNNFKPLIQDSISEGNFNMVVGDIKQSIYRWRGGNWKILLDQIKADIGEQYCNEDSLITNRRSKQNVVEFNNSFFSKAPLILEKHWNARFGNGKEELKIKKAYQDVAQHAYDQSNEGMIDILFIDKKEVDDLEHEVNSRLIQNIQKLQDHNYRLSDITILVRTNDEGRRISNALMDYQKSSKSDKYNYDVISNESLFIRKNSAVNIIIQSIQLGTDMNESLFKEQLIYAYEHYYIGSENAKEIVLEFFEILESIPNHSLSSIIDIAVEHFNLYGRKKDLSYLVTFHDTIQEYLKYEVDSPSQFLIWWEDKKNRSIQLSGEQNAMKLMTIHKSKGLQFKAVLIPFCSWSMDHKGGFREQMLWCDTSTSDYLGKLPFLPLKYSSALNETIFASDYMSEKGDAYLDNLNLLYVALTRAEEVLFITSDFIPKNQPGVDSVADLLLEFSKQEDMMIVDIHEGATNMISGNLPSHTEYPVEEKIGIEIEAKKDFSINHQHLKFKSDQHILQEEQQRSIDYGEIVHWVFSKIEVKNDFKRALNQAVSKFSLSNEELVEIKSLLRKVWDLPEVANWFSGAWQVKNESSILLENGRVKRPDRVVFDNDTTLVIDYKTGKELSTHKTQVADYKRLLEQMGFMKVKGYLLYLNSFQVVEV